MNLHQNCVLLAGTESVSGISAYYDYPHSPHSTMAGHGNAAEMMQSELEMAHGASKEGALGREEGSPQREEPNDLRSIEIMENEAYLRQGELVENIAYTKEGGISADKNREIEAVYLKLVENEAYPIAEFRRSVRNADGTENRVYLGQLHLVTNEAYLNNVNRSETMSQTQISTTDAAFAL